ncbi:hypothetical protein BGZ46_004983 [Entomortierella lignicola]|nr:hypothetical protein BGZ46_004983 [Entomortierella lignicola]
MADQTTTIHAKTTAHPATVRPTGTAASRSTAIPSKPAASRAASRSGSSIAIIPTHTSSRAAPTTTPEPASGGSSGAMIGGIAAGVAVILALVGFLIFKKRRNAAVAAAAAAADKKRNMSDTSRSTNAAISGPMALSPENGTTAAPAHRPEAHFREQQQFRPGMRDELLAMPGGNNKKDQGPNNNQNNRPPGAGYQANNVNNKMNEKDIYSGNRQMSPTDSYDDTLVNYYGDIKESDSIGARQPAPQQKDISHGNLTPAPEYYMGKEDIDPRRDLRGLDSPDTYVRRAALTNSNNQSKTELSPRSSYSSDRSSAYLTLDQAQQAHNNRMMGHKQSIGSVDMLIVDRDSHINGPNNQSLLDPPPSAAFSVSTISMMPSLPPVASPAPFNGVKHQNGGPYEPRTQQGPKSGANSSKPKIDPYAESAYSEDFSDDRSLASGSYYNPNYAQQKQQQGRNQQHSGQSPTTYYPPGRQGGPYSPQATSPTYGQYQAPYPQPPYQGQQQGYNNNNTNNRHQQGPNAGPGFQRDGPYQRQF